MGGLVILAWLVAGIVLITLGNLMPNRILMVIGAAMVLMVAMVANF